MLSMVILLSCSEPFEFVGETGSILILDGKISTQIGKSFVQIYQLNEDGSRTAFTDFDIRVYDTEGQEFSFTISDPETNEFVPNVFGFAATEGVGYKVIASQADGITLESDFDVVARQVDFDFKIGDTTVVVPSQNNEPIFRQATTAIASIDIDRDSLYTKMDFEYRYMDFFTRDTVIVKEEDFVLFSCDDNNNCKDIEEVTAGFTTRFEWFFILRNRFCDSLASVTQINFVENCQDPSVTAGCCEYRDQWPTLFQLNVESISQESFRFWKDLEKLTSSDGLITDVFPFPIQGNVTCEGCEGDFFGLFRTSSEISKEQIVIL